MVYIKGFDKSSIKNKSIGGIEMKNILRGMKYEERAKLMQNAKDLGTHRIRMKNLADSITKEQGKLIGQRFQQAVVKRFGRTGPPKEVIERNIRFARHQRLSEEENTYESFARKLQKDRENRGNEANIDRRKGTTIIKSKEYNVTAHSQHAAGTGFIGSDQGANGFAGESKESSSSPIKPAEEGTVGITGPVKE